MASLIEKTACADLLPVTAGTLSLTEIVPQSIVSVAPFRGRLGDADAALRTLGLGFPAPNTSIVNGSSSILWTGREQAFLIDANPTSLEGLAALTDQTDGWAVLDLEGDGWRAALVRLFGIDLRPGTFGPGSVARTPLNHMACVLWCRDAGARMMVFRSMAKTAVHELHEAMSSVAARAKL